MADEEKKKDTDVKSIFQKIAENEKYRRIIFILGLIGIAFIFLSGYLKANPSGASVEAAAQPAAATSDQYVEQLETNLEEVINGISGGSEAKVLITLEKSAQYVYATEEKKSTQTTQDQTTGANSKNQENNSSETKYIIVKDADGSQKALAVTEIQPVVKGVIVVCKGGNIPSLQQNIIDAVTTALNISSARVCVIKAN